MNAATNVDDLLSEPICCIHCKRIMSRMKRPHTTRTNFWRCSFCLRMRHILSQTIQKDLLNPAKPKAKTKSKTGSKEKDGHSEITVDLS